MEIMDWLLESDVTKKAYQKFQAFKYRDIFEGGIAPKIYPVAVSDNSPRINIVLPHFKRRLVFGGVMTALKIFKSLYSLLGIEARIIVQTLGGHSDTYSYTFEDFKHNSKHHGIFYIEENDHIEVGRNDVFITTSWPTAYVTMPLLKWQKQHFSLQNRKLIYIIQDFEPGFYAWSPSYTLADSTYKQHPENIIAIFNSYELSSYFKKNGYSFAESFKFMPGLNDSLRNSLQNMKKLNLPRKKRILIYGRPTVERNVLKLVRMGLELWSKNYEDAFNWEILSLGETFDDFKLENNIVHVPGKLSLDEYAKTMLEAYAGVSLMISPHPSYPPLEMAAFGVRTITNSFDVKTDLSNYSKNITMIDCCTPESIAKSLEEICIGYGRVKTKITLKSAYVEGGTFDSCIDDVAKSTKKMLKADK